MRSSEEKKVLFLALSGIGNFLMQSPTIQALKSAHPEWHVTVWVAPRGTRALAEADSTIDKVIEAPIKFTTQHFRLVHRLAREHFEIGIVLSPGQLWKSAAHLYLAGVRQRIGHRYPFAGSNKSNFLLTDAVEEKLQTHDIEQNLALLAPLGIDVAAFQNQPYALEIPERNRAAAKELLTKLPVQNETMRVGFHAGSAPNFLWKRWPAERFIAVGRELITRRGAHILLFGDEAEHDLNKEVQRGLGERATIITSDLLTTAAVIADCDLFLSNDSGLMHAAVAVGVLTFGLFGPTDERETGPRGQRSHVIRAVGTTPAYHTEKNPTLGVSSHESMLNLTPGHVLATLDSVLSKDW